MPKKRNKSYLTPIADKLDALGITWTELPEDETHEIAELWLKSYCRRTPKHLDARIYRDYEWFDFTIVRASGIVRDAAMDAYLAQRPAPYYVLSMYLEYCLLCEPTTSYPDFAGTHADIYVANAKMKWCMVFSHEQPSGDGPFFAALPATSVR